LSFTLDAQNPMETLEKSFDAYMLVKSATERDGKKYLNGPAALVEEDGLGSDFDGDDLVQKAVEGGLETFMRLGGQVDWDHLYAKSHNPKHIIAKSVGVTPNPDGKGAPVVSVELFMQKELAKAAWEHHECGGILGFSLQGIAKARDPKNSKRITALDIHMMTITPMPKGYEGPRLTSGNASLGSIIKGMNAQLEAGDTEGWEPIEDIELISKSADLHEELKDDAKVAEKPAPRYKGSCEKCGNPLKDSLCEVCGNDNPINFKGGSVKQSPSTSKALEAGSGIVQAGETIGAALRTQDLLKPRKKRKKVQGDPQAKPLNNALSLAVAAYGATNAAALTKAILSAL
jgi:hypothetical protein